MHGGARAGGRAGVRTYVNSWTKFEIGPCSIMGIWYLWIVFQILNIKKETSITEANCAILMVRIELNWFYSTPTTITCTHMNDYISGCLA